MARSGSPQLLGTAPVESDGSFFVHVTREQALKIELLDKSGKTLKRKPDCSGCGAGSRESASGVTRVRRLRRRSRPGVVLAIDRSGGHDRGKSAMVIRRALTCWPGSRLSFCCGLLFFLQIFFSHNFAGEPRHHHPLRRRDREFRYQFHAQYRRGETRLSARKHGRRLRLVRLQQ